MRLNAVIPPCFSFQKAPINLHNHHFKLLKMSPTFLLLFLNLFFNLFLLFIKGPTHRGG